MEHATLQFHEHPAFKHFIDLTGKVFGRLTVLGYAGKKKKHGRWFCQCECGTVTDVIGSCLRGGNTGSCGCLQRDIATLHGETCGGNKTSLEYTSYTSAKYRCTNPNNERYEDYGGRGIEFRFASFEQFLGCVGRRPTPDHSLDRYPDVNGHYEPGNVRWATRTEQQNNRRTNHSLEFRGETRTIAEWSRLIGMRFNTLATRIKRGWTVERALTEGVHS
jgi:hypothetical protein